MERPPSEKPGTHAPHRETTSPAIPDPHLAARLLDAVEQAIIATDRYGRIIYWNRFAETLYGWSAPEVLGRNILEVTPVEETVAAEIMERLRAGESWIGEFPVRRKDGTPFPVRVTDSPIFDEQDELIGIVGVSADISEQKRAEQDLAERAHLLSLAGDVGRALTRADTLPATLQICAEALLRHLDLTLAAIWTLDEEAQVLEFQAAAGASPSAMAALRSVSLGEGLIGRVAREQQPAVVTEGEPDLEPALREWVRKERGAVAAGYPLVVEGRVHGVMALVARGPLTKATQEALRSVADEFALGVDRKQIEEAHARATRRQQALSQRLVEVQEEERRRLARELHDEIGQLLTRQEMLLRLATEGEGDAPPGEPARQHLREAVALTTELTARVRQLSLDLRPAMLDDLGLIPTLLWYFERYTEQTGVRVTFAHSGLEPRFPTEVENAAYRTVQEGLTNVARHAAVKEVTVRGWEAAGTLGVQVQDHGVGFDTSALLSTGFSSGLGGMRERAALIGGRLTVESRPGEGTRLTAEFPLPAS